MVHKIAVDWISSQQFYKRASRTWCLLSAHKYTMVSLMPSSPLLSVSKETSTSRSSCGSPWCGRALLAVCDRASPSKPRLTWSERHRSTESADVRAATLSGFIAAANHRQEVTRSCSLNKLSDCFGRSTAEPQLRQHLPPATIPPFPPRPPRFLL